MSDTFSFSSLPTAETESVEFKSSRTKPDSFADKMGCAVSAFANSGGGTFVAGVRNEDGLADGGLKIEGYRGRQNLCEWADQIINAVKPVPRYMVHLVRDAEGRGTIDADKAVLVVVVEESGAPPHMAPDGRYYIRAGRHTERASHFVLEALWAKRYWFKPQLTHLIREDPDDSETIQIGLRALTDAPALNVQMNLDPLPGLLRGHNCEEFPVQIGVVDSHCPFFFNITTRYDAERNREETFLLAVTYIDLAGNAYKYEKQVNLFRSLPSLRFARKGLRDIARALENIASKWPAIGDGENPLLS